MVQLESSVERTGDRVTVALAGEADLATIGQLRDALFGAVAQRPGRVVVDLRGLLFIDSMSISALIAARRAAFEHGTEFVVANPRGQVLKVFVVSGVLDALTGGEASGDEAGTALGA
ncbi:STAS domain-containing protein [Planosporangium sp. 12N6]|uniref:STAS domain-containing protein n=1 Tax=Planosporangium spinosum TaxID=3402278 RepID=UPI003CF956D9